MSNARGGSAITYLGELHALEEIDQSLHHRYREARGRQLPSTRVYRVERENELDQSANIRLGVRRQADLSPESLRGEIERERYSIRDQGWKLHLESLLEGDIEHDGSPQEALSIRRVGAYLGRLDSKVRGTESLDHSQGPLQTII